VAFSYFSEFQQMLESVLPEELQVWREKIRRKGIQQHHATKDPNSNHRSTSTIHSPIYFNAM